MEGCFLGISNLVLKFIENSKEPILAKTVLEKNKFGRLTVPDFKIYCKAKVIKIVRYWHMVRHIDKSIGQNKRPGNGSKYKYIVN